MDKITQLLDITEHPENYSEATLEKLFSDDDISQSYSMMAAASSAYNARRAAEHEPDDAEEAWEAFQSRHTVQARHTQWWRSAAIVIGILISGLAIAALWPLWHTTQQPERTETTPKSQEVSTKPTKLEEPLPSPAPQSRPVPQTIVFDNTTLEQIIRETTDYYDMTYSFENEAARQLRLHVKWNQQQPIDTFVNRLNRFEKFNITRHDNTIIIK